MTPERWERLKDIFFEALEKEGAERDEFLRRTCGEDQELFQLASGLIQGNERASDFPSAPLIGAQQLEQHLPLFKPGDLVAGRFVIEAFLASGGMGEVYGALDRVLNHKVALKTVLRGARSEQAIEALKHEIMSARRVTHPNVCRTYDIVEHGQPSLTLLTMELLDGPTLSRYLREHGPVTRAEALPIIEQLCAGLQAAHEAGVIHRDFKTGNVILASKEGTLRPVITDFGLALSPQSRREDTSLKAGTPGYMAPEQMAGKPSTTATDVYSLGVVIAAMLGAQRRPSTTDSPPEAQKPPKVVEDWSKIGNWRHVVERCLEEDPSKRFQHPADVARALRSVGLTRRRAAWAAVALIGIVFSAIYLRSLTNSGSETMMARKVADEPSGEMIWDVSSDSKWMALTTWSDGQLSIRDLKRHTVRHLTTKRTARESVFNALFDPGVTRVAYELYLDNGRETRVVGLDGRNDGLLLRDETVSAATPAAWSPDGRQLAVHVRWKDGRSGLGLLSVTSGTVTQVSISEQAQRAGSVRFSPSGKVLVFDAPKNGTQQLREILYVGIDGSGERRLISTLSDSYLAGLSPDGSRIAFVSDRSGAYGIWTATLSSTMTVGDPKVALAASGRIYPLRVANGGAFYYRLGLNFGRIYTARLDLQKRKTLSPPNEEGVGMFPSWSQSGELAYLGLRDMARPTLAFLPKGAGSKREMPVKVTVLNRPQWRTRGKLVGPGLGLGKEGFYEIDAVTGDAKHIGDFSDFETGFEGVWSADGNTWFNRFQQNRRGIFRFDFRTGKREVLFVPEQGQDLGLEILSLSPDGRTLAFHLRRGPKRELGTLMLMRSKGGTPRPLLTVQRPEAFQFGAFTWLPDSKALLVAKSQGESGPSQLWIVPVNGANPERVDFPAVKVRQLRLSPDGSTIAYHSTEGDLAELWALEGFLPRQ